MKNLYTYSDCWNVVSNGTTDANTCLFGLFSSLNGTSLYGKEDG